MASTKPKKKKCKDGRANLRPPAAAYDPSRRKQPDSGWLTVPIWAEKYDVDVWTVRAWIRKDYLETKPLTKTSFQVLDSPPDKHPTWDRYLRDVRTPGHISNEKRKKPIVASPGDEDIEHRKAQLRETYFPRFLKMEEKLPGRLSYTGKELRDHLGSHKEDGTYVPLNNNTLYSIWPTWGLKTTVLQNENPAQLSANRNPDKPSIDNRTYAAYLRSDLYAFLSGNWGVSGRSDIDTRLKKNIMGAPTTEDGYFHFDTNIVLPICADGFFAWMEDVKPMLRSKDKAGCFPIKLFPWQIEYAKEALSADKTGKLKYGMCFATTPRGEGKNLIHILFGLFRLFNGYSEEIKIAGNSKDEAKSQHFDNMKEIINDTPKLVNFPGLSTQAAQIAIMQGPKDILNSIECVPKSSGLHSNMTYGIITELHNYAPQDRKFYSNFTSSKRGHRNTQIGVDSTMEDPGTIMGDEYKKYTDGKLKLTYFYHRTSDDGYQNINTTPEYLEEERNRLTEDEFRKYWENKPAGSGSTYFGEKAVKKINLAGVDGIYGPSKELDHAVTNLYDLEAKLTKLVAARVKESSLVSLRQEIDALSSRFIHMDDLYRLSATWDDLEKLMKLFGIKAWVIGASVDRAAGEQIFSDRTALACIGRGIVDEFTSYYFKLDLFMPSTAEAGALEGKLEEWRERYYDVDKVIITEFQGLDLSLWCIKNGFETEFIHTTYKYQKPRFNDMYQAVNKGYFKSPTVPYYTDERGVLHEGYTNKSDIFIEELGAFRHTTMGDRGKFGPPDKRKRGGIKDDTIDAVCGAIYACNGGGMDEIARSAGERQTFKAEIYGNPELVGDYRED